MTDKEKKEEAIFLAKLKDMVSFVQRRNYPRYSMFLDEVQQYTAKTLLRREAQVAHCFFGGYKQAERKMLCVYPTDWTPDMLQFPFVPLRFSYPADYTLSHRDFLGAIMAKQYKRETIGDILPDQGVAYVLVCESIAEDLLAQITKVGNVGVSVEQAVLPDKLPLQKEALLTATLSSMRLDCVVAWLAGCSRTAAEQIIHAGRVQINYKDTLSKSVGVALQDILTIRGCGKFQVLEDQGRTRKGKIKCVVKKWVN